MTALFLEPRGTAFEVVHEARRRGYRTVVFSLEAQSLIQLSSAYRGLMESVDDWHVVPSFSDHATLLSLTRMLGEVAAIYYSLDIAAEPGSYLRAMLGLPATPVQVMHSILNKAELRERLFAQGLSELRSIPAESVLPATRWPFSGPMYFKPSFGAYSAYVKRCEKIEDLHAAHRAFVQRDGDAPVWLAQHIDRGGAILEEAIEGELMSVEAIFSRGQMQTFGITSRILLSTDSTVEMGSCFPYPHPMAETILEKVRRVYEALLFTEGPTHTEVIVSSDGRIEIIDLNPRFVGADVMQSINFALGAEVQSLLLDWALGKPVAAPLKTFGFSCLQYFLAPQPMKLESLALPVAPEVRFSNRLAEPGNELKPKGRQMDHLGCYLTFDKSYAGAIAHSKELRSHVLVNGKLGATY
jgi:hypothetical protein